MSRLNKSFVLDEWVPALRSGAYEQGKHCLRDAGNKFCCLGVACDLLVKKGELPAWKLINSSSLYTIPLPYSPSEETSWGGLPMMASMRIGLGTLGSYATEDGCKEFPGLGTCFLANANDSGATFDEIAAALEALCASEADEEAA